MQKNRIFCIALLMAVFSINAMGQDDDSGGGDIGVSVEFTASPFENTQALLTPGFVRAKYMFGPIGARLAFMASVNNNETDPTTVLHSGYFDFRPGGEYHFRMGKASPYAGIEVIIQNQSSNKNSTSELGVAGAINENGAKQAFFGFGGGLFTGVDYYWGENFYFGIEVGVEVISRSYKSVEMAGQEIIEPTNDFMVNTNLSNAFKFGFTF